MSQITHFCGVKLLAWKYGCVKFWTNIMSGFIYVCFFSLVRARWWESSILQRRKIKIQSEKVWHVASDVWDAWCTFALLVAFCGSNYIFGAVQFSPLLGRVGEKWQCQSGLRENGIGSTHTMQPKSIQKCGGKTQYRVNSSWWERRNRHDQKLANMTSLLPKPEAERKESNLVESSIAR